MSNEFVSNDMNFKRLCLLLEGVSYASARCLAGRSVLRLVVAEVRDPRERRKLRRFQKVAQTSCRRFRWRRCRRPREALRAALEHPYQDFETKYYGADCQLPEVVGAVSESI